MVEAFKCKTCSHGTIADYSNVLPRIFFHAVGNGHTQCSGNGSGTMTHTKSIVFAFASFRKSTETFVDPVGVEFSSATGKNFMAVCLMTYVPYNLVFGSIEHIVQGNC